MSNLEKIIREHKVKEAIASVARFTVAQEKEAGFAVYDKAGVPELSRVVRGAYDIVDKRKAYLLPDPEDTATSYGEWGHAYIQVNLEQLTRQAAEETEEVPVEGEGVYGLASAEAEGFNAMRDWGRPRRDIDLTIHSHPVFVKHGGVPEEALRPSIADLETADELANYNPGVVEGILVAEAHLAVASVLFYRRKPNSRPFYASLDHEASARRMRELMAANGYSNAIVQFQYNKKYWMPGTAVIIRKFLCD